jgi:hypothetical protein
MGATISAASDLPPNYLDQGLRHPRSTYQNPWYDQASHFLPRSLTKLYSDCQYYAVAHPLVSAILYKLATFAVTDILFDTEHPGVLKRFRELLIDDLGLRQFNVEVILDELAFGNAFVSVHYPFRKYLRCRSCEKETAVDQATYRFYGYHFHLTCKKCGAYGPAQAFDRPRTSPKEIRLVRWNPKYIDVIPTGIDGVFRYRLRLSTQKRTDISQGKESVIQTVPQDYIDALRENRPIYFRPGKLFHLKRPGPSLDEPGLGPPLVLPVLKDVHHVQMLRKANEVIAAEHMVPLRILFPAANGGDKSLGAPHMPSSLNLEDWQDAVRTEFALWRRDPNRVPVMPLPVGVQSIGGDGRSLLTHQEIRVWAEWICAAMHVPSEFVFGGVSWSGSSVSMKFVQNTIASVRYDSIRMTNWVVREVASFLGWRPVKARYRRFKAMDDLQQRQADMSLAMQKKLSWKTVLEDLERDPESEFEQILLETRAELEVQRVQQMGAARVGAEAQNIQMAAQARAQAGMPQAPPDGSGVSSPPPTDPGAQEQGAAPSGSPQDPGAQQQGQAMPQQQDLGPAPPQGGTPYGGMQSPIGANRVQAGMNAVDLRLAAASIVQQLRTMTEMDRNSTLNEIQMTNPQLHAMVLQYLYQPAPQAMQPLPEQLPPRRGAEYAS